MKNSLKQLVAFVALAPVLVMPLKAFAQKAEVTADTLSHYKLEEITVSATRIDQPLIYQPAGVEVIDSSRMALLGGQNLGQILSMESSLFIKNNGPGGMATISQRGLSPEQTQVLWEGIPINSLFLGLSDLSLLPTHFFSSMEVSSGTPSSAFGGGGLAGAVYLHSDAGKAQNISLTQEAGAFGNYRSAIEANYYHGKWKAGINAKYGNSENDFSFYNRAFGKEAQRTHNASERFNLMANAAYESVDHYFDTKLWISDSHNQIPGNILNRSSRATQDDKTTRWLSRYRTSFGGTHFTFKNYLEQISLNYFEPEINVESYTQSRRWLASMAMKRPVSDYLIWKGEVSGSIAGVESNNYTDLKIRRKLSVLVNPEMVIFNDHLRLYPALRVDAYSDFGTEVSPSLGVNYELSEHLFLRGQFSHNFNPPTFNALYWPQGGNPNLEPEQSINLEVGATARFKLPFIQKIELSAYQIDVEQGIRWYPNENAIYAPLNVENIRVRGLELSTQSRWYLGNDVFLKWEQKGARVRSVITEPRFNGDAAVGNQMRYVPEWSYQTSLEFQKGNFHGLVHYRWNGRRFITDTENVSYSLDPYQIVDAVFRAEKDFSSVKFIGSIRVKNLLNEQYEIIQWYPMPGRNIHFTLTATYNF